MSRQNQWFVPGEGIAREVITADIQRYLGPDALVRPGPGTGEFEGRSGYWITAYRTLTSQMIQDLRSDSQRWQQERPIGDGRGVPYQDSRTHAHRQHWGPTQAAEGSSRQSGYATGQYPSGDPHYTTTPQAPYPGTHQSYTAPPTGHSAPRTSATDAYSYPSSSGREHPAYATPSNYYPQQNPRDPYGQPAATPSAYPPSSQAAPGYYIASDGRQYPLAQQPQPSQNQQPGRRR